MNNNAILLCFFLLATVLVACGPMYKTDYVFAPPPTSSGKVCSQNCLNSLPVCRETCEMKRGRCISAQQEKAKQDYFDYLREFKRSEQKPTKDQEDFLNVSMCRFYSCEEDCDQVHRICHTNCGGNITTNRYCVSNCEQK